MQTTLPALGTPGEVHGGQPQQHGCYELGLRGEGRRGRSIRGLRRARARVPRENHPALRFRQAGMWAASARIERPREGRRGGED